MTSFLVNTLSPHCPHFQQGEIEAETWRPQPESGKDPADTASPGPGVRAGVTFQNASRAERGECEAFLWNVSETFLATGHDILKNQLSRSDL